MSTYICWIDDTNHNTRLYAVSAPTAGDALSKVENHVEADPLRPDVWCTLELSGSRDPQHIYTFPSNALSKALTYHEEEESNV